MKYLVVSDNHGDRDILVEIANENRTKVEKMFHCGDSELLPDDPLWNEFIVVRGNCDYDKRFPEKVTVKTELDTIFMTHGHLSNVRADLNTIALQGAEQEANIILFGHTHILGCEKNNGVFYLNPGSISQPRGPINIKTYAIIESTENLFDIQYFNRIHQPLEKLHFIFEK